jgi:CHAT domain-containing protein
VSGRDSKIHATPLSDAPWRAIVNGVTQLSYMLDTRSAYLWVRDSTGIRATTLAASPAMIARDAAALTKAIQARASQKLDEALIRLSGDLLPPGVFASNATTIQVAADGRIAGIPFAALRAQGPLHVETITSLFEARATQRPGPHHPLDLVALASDARSIAGAPESQVFSILQMTNAEARSIAAIFQTRNPQSAVKLLLGAEGNAGNLMKLWQGGVDAVHFATHGLSDPRQSLTSLILLPAPNAEGMASYLTAGQVQEWRGDVNLVFLGACDTAVGPARFAEGMTGMQGAFLRAGARGVIASLWPVEDIYASQFAADFYRRYTAGMPASQALSETQRAWMVPAPGVRESEQAYRRMTAWAHAYYVQ